MFSVSVISSATKNTQEMLCSKALPQQSSGKEECATRVSCRCSMPKIHIPPSLMRIPSMRAQAILQEIQSKQKNRPAPKHSEFTGKLCCPHCGKNYKRTKSSGTVGWNCSTYLSQGKVYCHGKKIPETTLQAVCASVLGTQDYCPATFTDRIDRIEVPEANCLRFIFKDGEIDERTWSDRSRRDSWTEEMKQAAAERTRQRRKNNVKSSNSHTATKISSQHCLRFHCQTPRRLRSCVHGQRRAVYKL